MRSLVVASSYTWRPSGWTLSKPHTSSSLLTSHSNAAPFRFVISDDLANADTPRCVRPTTLDPAVHYFLSIVWGLLSTSLTCSQHGAGQHYGARTASRSFTHCSKPHTSGGHDEVLCGLNMLRFRGARAHPRGHRATSTLRNVHCPGSAFP